MRQIERVFIIALILTPLIVLVQHHVSAQAPTNGGQGFPANGVLTPIVGDVGIGSDNGVLTGYSADGTKFSLKPSGGGTGIIVGTQITYTQVCQKGTGSVPAGYKNTCTMTITAIH
jgi:hypothetical protein